MDAKEFTVKLKQASRDGVLGKKPNTVEGTRKNKMEDKNSVYGTRFMNLTSSTHAGTSILSSINPAKMRDLTIYDSTLGSKRMGHNPPDNLNNMYGSYFGYYSKSYAPSYDGTFRSRSLMKKVNTREKNNQEGKDINYDECIEYVHSPVKFHLQRRREIFHKRDGCMIGNANENRFIAYNDTPLINTKHLKYQSPYFKNWADHSLDEYIKNPSDIRDENANHQMYNPSHKLVMKDLSAGLPNFHRYVNKDKRKEVVLGGKEVIGMEKAPNPYEYTDIR